MPEAISANGQLPWPIVTTVCVCVLWFCSLVLLLLPSSLDCVTFDTRKPASVVAKHLTTATVNPFPICPFGSEREKGKVERSSSFFPCCFDCFPRLCLAAATLLLMCLSAMFTLGLRRSCRSVLYSGRSGTVLQSLQSLSSSPTRSQFFVLFTFHSLRRHLTLLTLTFSSVVVGNLASN